MMLFIKRFSRTYSDVPILNYLFTKNHEWLKIISSEKTNGSSFYTTQIGITEYSQKALGDIVFVEMPKVNSKYEVDDPLAVVESVKGASDIYAPVSGKVIEINKKVEERPSLINKSAEKDGWICEMTISDTDLRKANLLTHQQAYNVLPTYCTSCMNDIFTALHNHATPFLIKSKNIKILSQPNEFYQEIIKRIRNSHHNIVISSLYIGTDSQSKLIIKELADRLDKVPKLNVTLVLDYSRCSRGSPTSFSIIIPLLARFKQDRVKILAYMNPTVNFLRNFLIFPAKIGELLGVHHMKYLIFDDNVLLTGANLNESYFTNRIDRYILFKNSPKFSDFFLTLTSDLSRIYYSAQEDGSFSPPSSMNIIGMKNKFKTLAPIDSNLPCLESSFDSETVWIYPCLQMAKHEIFCDSLVSKILYSNLSRFVEHRSIAYFCTSYFNVSSPDLSKFLLRNCKWKIITSSPQSNSFHKSNGLSSVIPNLYQYFLQKFYKNLKKSKSDSQIYEFDCPDKSFHAKGIFAQLQDGTAFSSIGSPNFGSRSELRDNEVQFYMFSKNLQLNAMMKESFENLFAHGKLFNGSRNQSSYSKIVAKIFKSFL